MMLRNMKIEQKRCQEMRIGEVGKGCRVFAWKCLFGKLWLGKIEMENENIFPDETGDTKEELRPISGT